MERASADLDPPLLDQAPRLAAAEPEVLGEDRREVNRTVRPARLHRGLLDVIGDLAAHVNLVEALLGGRRRGRIVKALHQPPRELALRLCGVAVRVELLPEEQLVVLT